jgi:hypothetical protein
MQSDFTDSTQPQLKYKINKQKIKTILSQKKNWEHKISKNIFRLSDIGRVHSVNIWFFSNIRPQSKVTCDHVPVHARMSSAQSEAAIPHIGHVWYNICVISDSWDTSDERTIRDGSFVYSDDPFVEICTLSMILLEHEVKYYCTEGSLVVVGVVITRF